MAENEKQNRMIEYLLHNKRDKAQPDSLDRKFQTEQGKTLR